MIPGDIYAQNRGGVSTHGLFRPSQFLSAFGRTQGGIVDFEIFIFPGKKGFTPAIGEKVLIMPPLHVNPPPRS